VKPWLTFIVLSIATAFVYSEAWMLLSSAVVAVTDAAWSLYELCICIAAFGTAWLVRRYAKVWPLAVVCVAGAIPVLTIWLYASRSPSWDIMTMYLRWAALQPFVFGAVMLPVAFLLLGRLRSNEVTERSAS